MPTLGAIVWAAIAGVIVMMLGVIGYLIKTGFEGVKEQLKTIWEKIDADNKETKQNALDIREINTRCEERHKEHSVQRSGVDRRKSA